jgi:hypothetical protein
MTPRHNGAVELLYLLDEGLRSRAESLKRLESGQAIAADFAAREI